MADTVILLATPAQEALWRTLDDRLSGPVLRGKLCSGECYLLLEGTAPAAVLRWGLFWDEVPFCNLLYVREDRRGQGLGRLLMARWEADMAALGYELAMVSTQADESAQHFYRRLGYRDAGGFVVDVPGHQQPLELMMLKQLPPPEKGACPC